MKVNCIVVRLVQLSTNSSRVSQMKQRKHNANSSSIYQEQWHSMDARESNDAIRSDPCHGMSLWLDAWLKYCYFVLNNWLRTRLLSYYYNSRTQYNRDADPVTYFCLSVFLLEYVHKISCNNLDMMYWFFRYLFTLRFSKGWIDTVIPDRTLPVCIWVICDQLFECNIW